MKLVTRETFAAMRSLGLIQERGRTPGYSDYTKTMKKHSKARRHKYYVREDKLAAYLKIKESTPTPTGGEK